MAFRAICIGLVFSSLLTAGCGTVANLVKSGPDGGKTPFGGVSYDESCIRKTVKAEFDVEAYPQPEPEQHQQVALMLLCVADLPFSLIGDLVTWPYTAAYTYINQPIPTPPVTFATTESLPQQASPSPVVPKPTKLP